MRFLDKILTELLEQNPDLSGFNIVLPGKRPIVFIKRILMEKGYSGFLPAFHTIEDLILEISGMQRLQGIGLWLFAYEVYSELNLSPKDDFAGFVKWFPTVLKDWDDILKFADSDSAVLEYMFDEERIKAWAQDLGEQEELPRKKYLTFWRNMNVFLPVLKQKLRERNWATSGMIHEAVRGKIEPFAQQTSKVFVFCGFNAFTKVEEQLVRSLLQWDRGQVFFQGDAYYVDDEKQEAGKFLREHRKWKEFNNNRDFRWIENDFRESKKIKVYEVSGNVSQTKILPGILRGIKDRETDLSDTAVVLLDENLLPATLDALAEVEILNITMGFPLRNLGFSNAVKHLFHLHKQLESKPGSYYYNDLFSILEELPNSDGDLRIISDFKSFVESRNIVYLSGRLVSEHLKNLSYFGLFLPAADVNAFLDLIIDFCFKLKFNELDDIQYENISHFEKSFRVIRNQLAPYRFPVKMETLEVLVNQLVNSEAIDFQGEPLQGLQVMGLLETRLLNFRNIILLSVNEGKLPLGNTQNSYLPFDVRTHFNLHTFLENDSIYAYHFYRLLQDAENVHLLYNALSSGVNTGEKSRFITQLEFEDHFHQIEHVVIENASDPMSKQPVIIEKTQAVLDQLEVWKTRISATHLTGYLYNPLDFYLTKILKTREASQIEEELSVMNYGNLVHYALQVIYEGVGNEVLQEGDLALTDDQFLEVINISIENLNHQPEFYDKGMNYIHKNVALRAVKKVVQHDLELIRSGRQLRIIALEHEFQDVDFYLDEDRTDKVSFYGFIDRIDELDGVLRIIDYKTGKSKELKVSIEDKNREDFFFNDSKKQALQLCIYNYVIERLPQFAGRSIQTGIWSFAEVGKGVVPLHFEKGELQDAMVSIRNLILEILNPEIPFTESVHETFEI